MAVVLAFSLNVRAESQWLKKGEPAPFAGMLLDKNLELRARTALEQNSTYRELAEDQYDMINNLHQQNRVLDEKIVILSNNQEDNMTRLLYFIGGILVGGLAVHEIRK